MAKPRGPNPNAWITGPNPITHQQYECYLKQKAQAQFRGESWQFDFESWRLVWAPHWHRRGRATDDLCMTRRDPRGAWRSDNVMLIERGEHAKRWQRHREEQKRKKKIERQRYGKQEV